MDSTLTRATHRNVSRMNHTPTLERMRHVAGRLAPHVLRTPTVPWPSTLPGSVAELHVKLECLQHAGSFKPRGALNCMLELLQADASALANGVVAFSAGNHAIATAWSGQALGVSVTVVMPETADPARIQRCRELGASVVFGQDVGELMARVEEIRAREGRVLVHPFEGVSTIEGTACVGLEICDDVPALDALVVPIGGGGLIAGIASAVAQLQPGCQVIGVEPEGAMGMSTSLARGAPLARVPVDTIADSLGAPLHLPISYSLVERHVSRVVTVSDDALRVAMRALADDMKLMVEPACAATLAALQGPLTMELSGRRVAILACGSNIGRERWWRLAGAA